MEWVIAGLGAMAATGGILVLVVGADAQRRTWEEIEGLARALERRRKGGISGAGGAPDPGASREGAEGASGSGLDREVRSLDAYARKRPADAASVLRLLSGRARGGP